MTIFFCVAIGILPTEFGGMITDTVANNSLSKSILIGRVIIINVVVIFGK